MAQFIKELSGGWYDFAETHVYNKAELEDKLKNNSENSIIGSDEAVSSLFKREWHDNKQIEIVKTLNMYRDKCHTLFLLIPHFWDLDTAVRNSLIIKWWIYVYGLGEAVIFTHDSNPFSLDPWNLRLNVRLWSKGHVYKSPNYLFNVRWKELPETTYNHYKKVKAEKRRYHHKKEMEETQQKQETEMTHKELILNIKKKNPTITGHAIGELLPGVTTRFVYLTLKAAGLTKKKERV